MIPWGEHWIIGATDTPWAHDKTRPVASASDVNYLLAGVNTILAKPIMLSDVESVFAGLRPLIAGSSAETTKLSRRARHRNTSPGARRNLGWQVHDLPDHGQRRGRRRSARTARSAGVGHGQDSAPRGERGYHLPQWPGPLAARFGLSPAQIVRLIGRYGTLVEEVLEPAANDPSLLQPLTGGPGYLRAEVLYGATHEGALHVEDIVRRRLRLDWETPDRGVASLDEVTSIMGRALAWSADKREQELTYYRRLVTAELAANCSRTTPEPPPSWERLEDPDWIYERAK